MLRFMESPLGQIVARNGILAIILAWALWTNSQITARLFTVIEKNSVALSELTNAVKGLIHDR